MNPRIEKVRQRFSVRGPRPRYLAAALILEGSLLAISLWIPGRRDLRAGELSQGLQIATAWREAVEPLEEEPAESAAMPHHEESEVKPMIELTRFRIVETEPLPEQDSPPVPEPLPVEPQIRERDWLQRILERPHREAVTASPASTPQVRLLPLEGSCPKPEYPPRAVRLGLEGSIRFKIHVDAAGCVSRLEVLEQDCPRILLQAAETALLRWRFQGGPGAYEKLVVFSLIDRD